MNKKSHEKQNWQISEMAAHIPKEDIVPIEPSGDSTLHPSPENIKALALQKRKDYINGKEEKTVKKAGFRIILVAAAISLMSITVFAAFGGLAYIKSIFGDSAQTIQDQILTPQVTASADGREMAMEAVVTDGFITNMIVSLTGGQPSQDNLFNIISTEGIRSYGWYQLDEFTVPDKTYYAVNIENERRLQSVAVTLVLNKDIADIALEFEIENRLGNAVVEFPEGVVSESFHMKELQVSSMGFLLMGSEDDARGGLPTTEIRLVFSDHQIEDMIVEFDLSDETISAGGGAIFPGEGEIIPLVTTFAGYRNPEGELVITGQFSRIINPQAVEKVIINGNEYLVRN